VFVYKETRSCAKLYIFLKSLGLAFYTSTLTTCSISANTLTTYMLVVMMGSLVNSMRYEYAHFKKYGQVFSLYEFEMWKNAQWPRLRLFFSIFDLGIKIAFFIEEYPPTFEFYNACHVGKSVLKIHIVVLSLLYTLFGILCTFLFTLFYCFTYTYIPPTPAPASSQHVILNTITTATIVDNQTECCICLDKTHQPWTVLPCGHMFHRPCISTWINYHDSCPICRFVIAPPPHTYVI
jgi:E3 ubiquitin-protein ligase RNF115/126